MGLPSPKSGSVGASAKERAKQVGLWQRCSGACGHVTPWRSCFWVWGRETGIEKERESNEIATAIFAMAFSHPAWTQKRFKWVLAQKMWLGTISTVNLGGVEGCGRVRMVPLSFWFLSVSYFAVILAKFEANPCDEASFGLVAFPRFIGSSAVSVGSWI